MQKTVMYTLVLSKAALQKTCFCHHPPRQCDKPTLDFGPRGFGSRVAVVLLVVAILLLDGANYAWSNRTQHSCHQHNATCFQTDTLSRKSWAWRRGPDADKRLCFRTRQQMPKTPLGIRPEITSVSHHIVRTEICPQSKQRLVYTIGREFAEEMALGWRPNLFVARQQKQVCTSVGGENEMQLLT